MRLNCRRFVRVRIAQIVTVVVLSLFLGTRAHAQTAILIGARNLTMGQIAAALIATGRLTRPAVDQTGIGGRFDFTLEWIRESNNAGPIDLQEGTTFQEALQEQLGLKLKSTKATMDTLVIDHVERPTEN